jgi:hypothetical protein
MRSSTLEHPIATPGMGFVDGKARLPDTDPRIMGIEISRL